MNLKTNDSVDFSACCKTKYETDGIDIKFETTKKLEGVEDASYCSEQYCENKPTRYSMFKL